jgi:phospholipid transport system substrate-binding protein
MAARQAATFIETLGVDLLAIQADRGEDVVETRPAALEGLIRRGFDLDLTSQLVLGKNWTRASEAQRGAFKELFAPYLLQSYVRYLDVYRVETLDVVDYNSVGQSDFLVETRVEGGGDDGAVRPIWRVRARDGGYKIIDVHVDGISLALTQRSEFASAIRRNGFDGMLAALRGRLAGRTEVAGGKLHEAFPASLLTSPNVSKIGLLMRQQ